MAPFRPIFGSQMATLKENKHKDIYQKHKNETRVACSSIISKNPVLPQFEAPDTEHLTSGTNQNIQHFNKPEITLDAILAVPVGTN